MVEGKNKAILILSLIFTLFFLGFTSACYCGDGSINQPTEQCDDGNIVNFDGCSATCLIEERCNLELTKSVCKETAKPNDILTYTLKYKNIGGSVCTGGGVKIQDTLNSNLNYSGTYTKSILNDIDSQGLDSAWYTIPGYDALTNTLTWNAHVVSPGEEGTITFEVKVLTPTQCGDFQIPNYFKAWSNQEDWKNSNTVNINIDNDCPVCGDGIVNQANETCDDGNIVNNDGCSSICKIESCGDNICNGAETCSTCSNDCGVCPPICGDGNLDAGEECDDGNLVSGDGCSSSCLIEKPCNLQLTKSVSKQTAEPNDILTYTLKYKNTGDIACTGSGVIIQDVLNENLLYDGIYTKDILNDVDSQGISYDGYYVSSRTLNWNANIVSPNEEGTITFNVEVLTPTQCGDFQITNYFKVWSVEKSWQNSNILNVLVDNNCPPPQPVCGDGTCNGAETCSTCSCDCGVCPLPTPVCGNGIKETGEECDDGNIVCDDGCSSTCKIENNNDENNIVKLNHFVQYCDANWLCSGWSECSNGVMTRECVDNNHCDIEYNKPYEQSGCNGNILSNAYVEGKSINYLWIIIGIIIFVILLIILINLL